MEGEIVSKSSFMRRRLYTRKIIFYYKKEVRIWKRSLYEQKTATMKRKFSILGKKYFIIRRKLEYGKGLFMNERVLL